MEEPLNLIEASEKIRNHCIFVCSPAKIVSEKRFEECFEECFEREMKKVISSE